MNETAVKMKERLEAFCKSHPLFRVSDRDDNGSKDSLGWSFRDNGDIGEETPGEGDLARAREMAKALREEFGREIRVRAETVDEWVSVTVYPIPEIPKKEEVAIILEQSGVIEAAERAGLGFPAKPDYFIYDAEKYRTMRGSADFRSAMPASDSKREGFFCGVNMVDPEMPWRSFGVGLDNHGQFAVMEAHSYPDRVAVYPFNEEGVAEILLVNRRAAARQRGGQLFENGEEFWNGFKTVGKTLIEEVADNEDWVEARVPGATEDLPSVACDPGISGNLFRDFSITKLDLTGFQPEVNVRERNRYSWMGARIGFTSTIDPRVGAEVFCVPAWKALNDGSGEDSVSYEFEGLWGWSRVNTPDNFSYEVSYDHPLQRLSKQSMEDSWNKLTKGYTMVGLRDKDAFESREKIVEAIGQCVKQTIEKLGRGLPPEAQPGRDADGRVPDLVNLALARLEEKSRQRNGGVRV